MHLTLENPLDMHLHLREREMLALVAPCSAAQFAGGVIMPNLVQPVDSLERLRAYRAAILDACAGEPFTPYMTLFFRSYHREELLAARDEIIGLKLYPAGITTQSESGVRDFDRIGDTVALLEDLDIPLLVHGETDGFVMEREREFLRVYQWLAETFPRLRLVMEHITTAEAVELLDRYDNVGATVTLHHLLITLDDVVGGLLQPDLFCKPIAKTPRDREALRQAVLAGHPRLMFGSDSAPHPRHKKECCGCAAGVFSAPVLLPALAQLFEEADCLERLADFVSHHARRFYRLRPPHKQVHLVRAPWTVMEQYETLRPFLAGQTLRWRVEKRP
ncbi:dihydroorotase [Desulfobulbus propionicus DSM 2032]|jgi:dihydroorotase|uniref:Dihydroorotase n=1 Tax=Desulfobulbus propionicus (strain ATCC 33891 / DSM 2032 / VKM B-1956 / 1pr3) TaxID=577650 RepID=A0A7U3YPH7_DESPD|nr:dihydroorotase [Desulfobulbus propionicus]ADW19129.1 dihydroorotase [Desulfobulbus propionicus DSM 2032]